MIQIKPILEQILTHNQNPEYATIVAKVNHYIDKRCNHYIVTDLIDINPDESKIVYYCDYCYQTFTAPPK
jgi:hypothetical protein